MTNLTKLDVLEQAQEYNVKFIRLQFTDILGVFKNIAVTVEELPKVLEGHILFDSSVVDGMVNNRRSEIRLLPDPSTFTVFPWRPREGAVARLICDVMNPDGTPYGSCSRQVLKRAIDEVEDMGLRLMVGADAEFFMFHTDEKSNPTLTTQDVAGFCDLSPVDLGENARRDMVLTLEEMGYEITSSHHEFSPGQHEISLKCDDALAMADKLVTFRFVVRTIAKRHGLHASFMPKPMNAVSGSGLNIYQSLFRETDNVFFDPHGVEQNSETLGFYIGGLLRHAKSFACITNPIINSYKRLTSSELSPCYVAWSRESRNTAVRVPANKGDETRVEMRSPDSASNPYLVIAVMLKAGLEGIENRIAIPAPVSENLCTLTPKELNARAMTKLPRNLDEALQLMKSDRVIIDMIGEELAAKYISAKEAEWARFENHVHNWEVDEYLSTY